MSGTNTQASRAEDFINSIGVNTHIGWNGTVWSNWSVVNNALTYLGIHYIRDNIPNSSSMTSEYQTLNSMGVHIDLLDVGYSGPSGFASGAEALNQAAPGFISTIEGLNEVNSPTNNVSYDGGQTNSSTQVADQYQADLYSAIKGYSDLSNLQILDFTFSNGISGWQSYLDAAASGSPSPAQNSTDGNWHVYYADGQQPAANLQQGIQYANESWCAFLYYRKRLFHRH